MVFSLGFGAYQSSKDPANYHLSLAVSGVLTGVMGYRFINSGKFMPAGTRFETLVKEENLINFDQYWFVLSYLKICFDSKCFLTNLL